MRDEKEEIKKQAKSNKQTNKAKQHSTPKAVPFPRKNELPQAMYVHVHLNYYRHVHTVCVKKHFHTIAAVKHHLNGRVVQKTTVM